jgi:hypothetical protein
VAAARVPARTGSSENYPSHTRREAMAECSLLAPGLLRRLLRLPQPHERPPIQ